MDSDSAEPEARRVRRSFENEDVSLLPDRRVDFDTTVNAMALTAKEMNSKYKETSEGGLAVSVVLC